MRGDVENIDQTNGKGSYLVECCYVRSADAPTAISNRATKRNGMEFLNGSAKIMCTKTEYPVVALLFRQASERYKTLEVRDEDIKAKEMREALAGREEIEEFDEELYRKLIKQIVVYKDDSVRVIFLNNNSIKIGYRDL